MGEECTLLHTSPIIWESGLATYYQDCDFLEKSDITVPLSPIFYSDINLSSASAWWHLFTGLCSTPGIHKQTFLSFSPQCDFISFSKIGWYVELMGGADGLIKYDTEAWNTGCLCATWSAALLRCGCSLACLYSHRLRGSCSSCSSSSV